MAEDLGDVDFGVDDDIAHVCPHALESRMKEAIRRRVRINNGGAQARFAYSTDGTQFNSLGSTLSLNKNRWCSRAVIQTSTPITADFPIGSG
jgi:hypothetical protein